MPDNLIFDVKREPNKLKVHLSSTMALVDSVAKEVQNFIAGGPAEKHSFSVGVVLREGLTNAVRHGNKKNPGNLVLFKLFIDNNIVTMVIEDEGEGFDWKNLKKNCSSKDDDAIPLEHGRGVCIIEEYFDEYDYNEKGNILTIKKDVSS